MEFYREANREKQSYCLVIKLQRGSRQQSYHLMIKLEREVKFVSGLLD